MKIFLVRGGGAPRAHRVEGQTQVSMEAIDRSRGSWAKEELGPSGDDGQVAKSVMAEAPDLAP